MSDVPTDWRGQIDLRAELSRIDRDRAETRKLQEESDKFVAEQRKLIAESRNLDRDRWLVPALAIIAMIGGLLGMATFIAHLIGRWPAWHSAGEILARESRSRRGLQAKWHRRPQMVNTLRHRAAVRTPLPRSGEG